jgi:SH3-like domain-containing protein
MRTSAKTSNLRAAPTTKSTVLKQLAIHTPIRITGSTSDWFRIILPDGSSGYLAASLVETAERPIGQEPTNDRMYIWDAPDPVATPIAHIDKDDMVDILAKFNSFFLVRSSDGIYGWIPETSS